MIGRPEYTLTLPPPVQPTGTTSVHHRGVDLVAPGGKVQGLAAAPAVAHDAHLAVGEALALDVLDGARQIFHATVRIQAPDGDAGVFRRLLLRGAAVR